MKNGSDRHDAIGFGRQMSDRLTNAVATSWFMESLLAISLMVMASVIG